MTDKINVAELRASTGDHKRFEPPLIADATMLALLDAVEAAQAFLETSLGKADIATLTRNMVNALAKFDFGDQR